MVLFFLVTSNNTIRFYSDLTLIWEKPVVNLSPGDNLFGIDLNPNDMLLYGLGYDSSTCRLYTLDTSGATVNAILLGILGDPFPISFAGASKFGFDVNPAANRIRVITDTGQNVAVNQTAALLGSVPSTVQTTINPSNNKIYAAAYTNNVAGALSTQLYDIGIDTNVSSSQLALYLQNPPANGTVTKIGDIITAFPDVDAHFDIFSLSEGNNEAYYISTEGVGIGITTFLNRLDLTNAAATRIGVIASDIMSRGFAIIPSIVPCLHPRTLVQVRINDVEESKAIEDLRANDTIIDFKGNSIKLINNIRFSDTNAFYKICKDALGKNIPDSDILIRGEHPILHKGKETNAKKLYNRLGDSKVQKVVGKSIPVYSLATKKRTFVKMQNLMVCTWDNDELENMKKFYYVRM